MHASTFGVYPGVSRHLAVDFQGGNPAHARNAGLDWRHAGFTHDALWDRLSPGTLPDLPPLPATWWRFGVVIGAPEAEGALDPDVLLHLQPATVQVMVFRE